MPSESEVQALLHNLRVKPEGNTVKEETLGAIFTYLYSVPANSAGEYHWYCPQASQLTIAAATFCIRLFAYNSEAVTLWKQRLRKCLSGCASCVRGMETAKEESRSCYMSAYESHRLDSFFVTFEAWELECFLHENPFVNDPASTPSYPLSEAALHQMLWNWTILSDSRIARYLQSNPPPSHITISGPIPPGVLVLLLVDVAPVRQWALSVCSSSTMISVNDKDPRSTYFRVLGTIIPASSNAVMHPQSGQGIIMNHYTLTTAQNIWPSFYSIIRLLPPSILSPHHNFAIPQLVINHLQDAGAEFIPIYNCFILLLKRLDDNLWKPASVPRPMTIIASLEQNPGFLAVTEQPNFVEHAKSQAASLQELLATTRNDASFCETFGSIVKILLDRSENGINEDIRDLSLTTLVNLISTVWRKSAEYQAIVAKGFASNAGVLVPLLYADEMRSEQSSKMILEARKIVENVLLMDCQAFAKVAGDFTDALIQKAKADKEKERGKNSKQVANPSVPAFAFSSGLWDQLFLVNNPRNPQLFAMAVKLAGKVYHLYSLRPYIFKPLETDKAMDVTGVINRYNTSLKSIHVGLGQLIAGFTNYSVSNDALALLKQGVVLESVVFMVLSHSSPLESAAKALVGLAYDVDGRAECLRALMENHPKESMKAMMDYLAHFHRYVVKAPEACDCSAALVRCFADILDVLCAQQDGLLHRSTFVLPSDKEGPGSLLPKFWKLLAKALSAIYDRTPMWSNHIPTPEMVSWMRDALILARDVMKQWRVIESVANPNNAQRPHKLSDVGKGMINDLQDFLPAVTKWLRLTDEELLHQSFTLLQNVLDVMNETDVRPLDTSLVKLRTFVISAQKSDPKKELRTRLDSGRLISLVKSLAQFDDDDDEVEIVEVPPPKTAKPPKPPQVVPPVQPEVKRPFIMGKDARSMKTSAVTSRGTTAPTTKKKSDYFSERDQQRLDSISSMPSFKRASTSAQPMASGSKVAISTGRSSVKDESSVGPMESEDSADDEDDEDEDEDDMRQTLGALGRIPKKSPVKAQPQPQRQKRSIIVLGGNINQAQSSGNYSNVVESSRNKAMRLKPDIGDLHRTILSWDYNHDGPSPPGPPLRLGRVPQTFQDYQHYFNTFRPLLLLECWHSLLQSKEEQQDSYTCVIDNRQYESDWSNLAVTIQGSVKKDWYLSETDIVLLAQPGNASKCALGKVVSYKTVPNIQASIRCLVKPGSGDPGLVLTSKWQISKVFSLSTVNREYEALVSLQYNRMCRSIMSPSLEKPPAQPKHVVQEVMDQYNVNEPQATAILNAVSSSSFSLIQGPPGTGKTSTICGLIARFLSTRPRAPVPIVAGKSNQAQQSTTPKPKILLCAPSNAAIDELVQRLKDGYVGAKKSDTGLNVVRIGTESAISNSVRDVSLDYLVDLKIDSAAGPVNELNESIKALRKQIEDIKQASRKKIEELETLDGIDNVIRRKAVQQEITALNMKRNNLMQQHDQKKDRHKSDYRALDTVRRHAREEILLGADVICSTLSGAGHDSLQGLDFDMIVIDEAAQSIELSSLIPLRFQPQRCVMVGDPQQLPPTVLSPKAKDHNYAQSLFVRLHESCKAAVQLLSIQYRMHPNISSLPSSLFYQKKLLDGPNMEQKTAQPWHNDEHFLPYRFFNVSRGLEQSNGHSMINEAESRIAVALYDRLRSRFSQIDFSFRVGVVSMYRAQLAAIKRSFEQRFGKDILNKIDFNTVDGFQGQEKDIIILSCVRAGPGLTSIGFLSDMRRMNVALTRAKSSLFILGHAATLERSDDTWKQIVQDARSRSCLVDVTDASYFAKNTRPSTTQIEGEPPKKKVKAAVAEAAPIPTDLVRPSEFKQPVPKPVVSKPDIHAETSSPTNRNDNPTQRQHTPPNDPQPTNVPSGVATSGPSTNSAGVKRRAPDGQTTSNARSGPPNQSTMRPPPAQKKQKTNSMFIPRKKR